MVATSRREKELIKQGFKYICGCDESGYGSLAGRVYTAAVVFPADFDFENKLKGLDDSKKKTEAQREELYSLIKECALSYCVATASVEEINDLNIYWARFLSIRRSIQGLIVKPDYVLMDGNALIPGIDISQEAIVKGDTKSVSIAASSILAKVERDRYIVRLADKVHQDYDWRSNKAYWCKKHTQAIEKHGKTQWHRDRFVRKIKVGKNA